VIHLVVEWVGCCHAFYHDWALISLLVVE